MEFKELIKNKDILKVINENGFTIPTQIQEEIIPLIRDGLDVLGQSQTGTGKTLAFAAPILEEVESNKKVQTLILAPTRELAIQIAREIEDYSKYMQIKATCVYGSSSIEDQIKKLKSGVEIVIGTPGRVKDLIKRGKLKLSEIKYFVLDEADEMLSMGFQEELEFIFEKTNNDKQVLLFSATMPKTIVGIAKKYMSPEYRTVSVISDVKTAEHITQNYYIVNEKTRLEAMCRIMDFYNPKRAMIFCRTKRNADDLIGQLSQKGYSVDVIHGDITQSQRIATLDRFKEGIFNYLIATDVAARGIHVDDVELVINHSLPESNEAYVHRIGRTGRANKSGIAVTLVKQNEMSIISSLENHINTKINKCDLPTMEEIVPNRVNEVVEYAKKLINKNTSLNTFNDYLETLSVEDIRNLTSKLLEKQLTKHLGSDFTSSVEVKKEEKKRHGKRELNGSIRVFMTIGKLDKIDKKELLNYVEKKSGVSQGTCSGVEIMSKFTFMNIKEDKYNQVYSKCNNTRFKDRLIRIEKAKK